MLPVAHSELTGDVPCWGHDGDLVPFEVAMRRMGFDDETLVGAGFDQFKCTTTKQRKLLDEVRLFAAGKKSRPGLFMFGSAGRGKTHLARSVAAHYLQTGRGFRYKRVQTLVAECKRRMDRDSTETPEQHVDWFCRFPGLLIIDELGRTSDSDWVRDSIVYPLVDARKAKPTIFISNFSLGELTAKYDEAITSRLQLCTCLEFPADMTDYRRL